MRYTVDERHERILELVRQHGTLRVTDLARHLQISTVTARRDVEALASRGRLNRVRGAVSWPGAPLVTDRGPLSAPVSHAGAVPDGEGLVLGMVLPQSQHYFGEIIRGAEEAAKEAGARLVLGFSGYQADQDEVQARRLVDAGAHGLLLAPGWMTDGTDKDARSLDFGVPTVLVERRPAAGTRAAEFDHVCSDHAGGAGLAVRHLAGLGHRKIALLAAGSATGVHVRAGYETGIRAAGLEHTQTLRIELPVGAINARNMEAAARQLVEAVEHQEISAALVVSDTDAIMLLQLLRGFDRQLRVPQDLAIVAYDDEVAALSDLPLTAVAPPKREVGRAAVGLLLQRVREGAQGQEAPRQHLALLPRLWIRQSCGAELQGE
ncbi:substrate-binding domain-containing protein [Streptomyces sp. NPDC090032]|uniref:LacI family DNA-binding transcriptional regulator n=1 Tax=Streptomyces sp. NPDC090032 TaxID=3365925 RepID=UPI0037F292AD